MKADIFQIQKFSLHDGPGIRTTVFFKGCPLSCKWCSNPESQSAVPSIFYNRAKCTGCQTCVGICPAGCLTVKDGRIHADTTKCRHCGRCVQMCPAGARTMQGQYMDLEDIVEICLQDKDFYEESGGGVTFSGGESFLQAEAVQNLAKMLKEKGIHLAVETTGHIPGQTFLQLAGLFDLIYFDVKHHDPDKHRQMTGAGNERILENLQAAKEAGLDIRVRIPVIPGFNDTKEDAAGFAAVLEHANIRQVELLPFHQMGERKYEWLGRDYLYRGMKGLDKQDLAGFRDVLEQRGIHCKIA